MFLSKKNVFLLLRQHKRRNTERCNAKGDNLCKFEPQRNSHFSSSFRPPNTASIPLIVLGIDLLILSRRQSLHDSSMHFEANRRVRVLRGLVRSCPSFSLTCHLLSFLVASIQALFEGDDVSRSVGEDQEASSLSERRVWLLGRFSFLLVQKWREVST